MAGMASASRHPRSAALRSAPVIASAACGGIRRLLDQVIDHARDYDREQQPGRQPQRGRHLDPVEVSLAEAPARQEAAGQHRHYGHDRHRRDAHAVVNAGPHPGFVVRLLGGRPPHDLQIPSCHRSPPDRGSSCRRQRAMIHGAPPWLVRAVVRRAVAYFDCCRPFIFIDSDLLITPQHRKATTTCRCNKGDSIFGGRHDHMGRRVEAVAGAAAGARVLAERSGHGDVASGRNLRVESVLGFRFVVSRVSLAHANRNFDCRLGI